MLFLLILYNFVHHAPVWQFYETARLKWQYKAEPDRTGNSPLPSGEWSRNLVSDDKEKASWELQRKNVGVYAIQGRRPHMEDRFNVLSDTEDRGITVLGVFDGHGGEFAAEFAEKTLLSSLLGKLVDTARSSNWSTDSASDLVASQVLEVDRQLLKAARSRIPLEISGTTSLIAVVLNSTLLVANTGDSRGVICNNNGKATPLSFDHKPYIVSERMRIQQAGGFISFNGVWRVAGVLATSRALGDLPLKDRKFLIADPDVTIVDLDFEKPRFMILATDGLWDYFSNEEAVEFVKARLSEPHLGAKSLVLQAYYRGSLDNITVMVVNFLSMQSGRWALA